MKQKVLIIHGWYGNTNSNWNLWLKFELEKLNYKVFIPDIKEFRNDIPDPKISNEIFITLN